MKRGKLTIAALIAVCTVSLILVLFFKNWSAQPMKQPAAPVEQGEIEHGDNDSKLKYFPNPKITVTNIHRNEKDPVNSGWMGETFIYNGSPMRIPGGGFIITVEFSSTINRESVLENIKLSGPGEIKMETRSFPTLYFNCNSMKPGEKYTLDIPKGIKDVFDNTLERDIKIEITGAADTYAHYTLLSKDYTYNLDDYINTEFVYITNSPKTIIIDFTKDVNKESVEKCISNQLSSLNMENSIKWLGDRKLELKASNLPKENGFMINMEGALDSEGFRIIGNLNTASGKPNSLGFIDMNTKASTIMKELADKRYMAVQNPSIKRYIILDDSTVNYIFDTEENKIINRFNGGRVWVDEDKSILFDCQSKSLLIHSLKDNSTKVIYSLAYLPDDWSIRMFDLSPDKKKIAVTLSPSEQGYRGKGDLCIISLDGKLLYEYKSIADVKPIKVGPEIHDFDWLDNCNIVIENNENSSRIDLSLIKVNIETGIKETILRNALTPVTLPGKDVILAERCRDGAARYSEFTVIQEGKETAQINMKTDKYPEGCMLSNFFFIDENKLVCNAEDEIILFDIKSNTKEVLGKGNIIGLSKDKDKVYYITDYQNLNIYY